MPDEALKIVASHSHFITGHAKYTRESWKIVVKAKVKV